MRHKVPAWGGLLLLAAALFLAFFNLRDAYRAEEEARAAAQQLRKAMAALPSDLPGEESAPPRETVPPAETFLPEDPEPPAEEAPQPRETEALLLLDGYDYLGILEIPALGLTLPVLAEWSDTYLKLAPCRYRGTAEGGDLILAGHNYRGHFGGLWRLKAGDRVTFQDVQGNRFCYTVSALETIPGTGLAEMEGGEWDLTLFTCTPGGQSRLTVRCCLTEE